VPADLVAGPARPATARREGARHRQSGRGPAARRTDHEPPALASPRPRRQPGQRRSDHSSAKSANSDFDRRSRSSCRARRYRTATVFGSVPSAVAICWLVRAAASSGDGLRLWGPERSQPEIDFRTRSGQIRKPRNLVIPGSSPEWTGCVAHFARRNQKQGTIQ